MRDTSFADKISRCEITLQSLESELPNIPGGETNVAEVRQRRSAPPGSRDLTELGLADALTAWFGPPSQAVVGLRAVAAPDRGRCYTT